MTARRPFDRTRQTPAHQQSTGKLGGAAAVARPSCGRHVLRGGFVPCPSLRWTPPAASTGVFPPQTDGKLRLPTITIPSFFSMKAQLAGRCTLCPITCADTLLGILPPVVRVRLRPARSSCRGGSAPSRGMTDSPGIAYTSEALSLGDSMSCPSASSESVELSVPSCTNLHMDQRQIASETAPSCG
jgi:hypothetical protein